MISAKARKSKRYSLLTCQVLPDSSNGMIEALNATVRKLKIALKNNDFQPATGFQNYLSPDILTCLSNFGEEGGMEHPVGRHSIHQG